MPGFNINEFKSELFSKNGPLRPSNFLVAISPPKWAAGKYTAKEFSYLCTNASLPGLTATFDRIRTQGVGIVEKRPNEMVFDDIDLGLIVDSKGTSLNFFQTWMQNISNINVSMGAGTYNNMKVYEFNYPDTFETVIDIYHFDTASNQILHYALNNAFPSRVNDVPVDWGLTDQFMKLSVTISYKYFTTQAFDAGSSSVPPSLSTSPNFNSPYSPPGLNRFVPSP